MENKSLGIVVALVADLFFSVRLGNHIKQAGYEPRIVKTADDFRSALHDDDAILGVVDLGSKANLDDLRVPEHRDVPIIAFGPHKDVDALREAKRVGFTRVMSNSQFHARTVEMIQRYARPFADDDSGT
ncbi:MAG: hypothetical protein WBW04_13600 [Nitrolancea sp.]